MNFTLDKRNNHPIRIGNSSSYTINFPEDYLLTDKDFETNQIIDFGIRFVVPHNCTAIFTPMRNDNYELTAKFYTSGEDVELASRIIKFDDGIVNVDDFTDAGILTFVEQFTLEPLRFKKLSEVATIPAQVHLGDAGFDLAAAYDGVIPAHGKGISKTDLAVAIPIGWYGRIAPRSSVAWKHHIDIGAGVIDSAFRGNVGIVLFNHSTEDFHYKAGERLAQLVIERCYIGHVVEVDELDDTDRGSGGFGSTGK